MKLFKIIPILAAATIAMVACNSADDATDGGGGRVEVEFSASTAEIQTRVTDNSWAAGDPVGIYMIDAASGLADGSIREGVNNRQYEAAAGPGAVAFTPMGGAIYYPMSGNVEFIAYHPYRQSLTNFRLPVSVATQTKQSAIDVLYAKKTNGNYSKSTAAPVPLAFEHKLVKLAFNITRGEGVTESFAGLTVKITGQETASTLDLTNGAVPVSNGGSATITALTAADGSSSEAIVLPNSSVAGMTFTFTTAGTGGGTYGAAVTAPNGRWEPGKKYTCGVTLKRNEVKVTVSVGNSWIAGGAHDIAGAPQVFSIEGYTGNIEVTYTDGSTVTAAADDINRHNSSGTVKSIKLNGVTHRIGRAVDVNNPIRLRFDASGNLLFRSAVNGFIPIGSYAEFQKISGSAQNKYRLEADLDLMNEEWTPIVITGQTYFNGEFDGAGKKISNLKITGSGNYRGLFSANQGTIRNVHIISGTVTGTGSYIGGICGGNNPSGQIISCSNAANVSGTVNYVGGVSGFSDGAVTACYNTGTVSGTGTVGGVSGDNTGTVTACYNTGAVSGNNRVGGVSGYNYTSTGAVTACYNTGTVSGTSNVGGVVGYNYTSTVTACYNTGAVAGTQYVGGVAGYNYTNTVTACYWKSGTAANGIGGGTGSSIVFTNYFNPSGNAAWGTGDGSDTNRWWKAGINYSNTLPKLWYE